MKLSEILQDIISDNTCIHCGNIVGEDLRKWFKQKWVNIGKKDKSGKHPECGTSGEKRGYAKCVPASKARRMSKKEKESAIIYFKDKLVSSSSVENFIKKIR